ncbi:hypothetical protein [Blattabacterium cuenoti]|uniref:hypothetical protein n=1 Tax=Blattabacterium cuenoti TaxID=1653831 RepID=UPI00163C1FED|nr:hypothetical protein [Blattabacterium cuenoti]
MNKNTKFIIFFLFFLFSIIFFYQKKYNIGSFIFSLGLIPIFFLFNNEFLLLAFIQIGKKNKKGLKKYLDYIKNPKLQLTNDQIACFYFLKGIYYSDKNINKSEFYMQKSLDSGLKFKQNIAIAKYNMAIASLSKGNKKNAEILLSEAKKMDVSGILKVQIELTRKQMQKFNLKYYKK